MFDSSGNVLVVEDRKVEITDKPTKVYNFQVADFHTYHVGDNSVLVHNANYNTEVSKADVEVEISRRKYPESAKHIEDAIANGQPDVLTINRSGAKPNRKASLKGIDKVPGKDLDEYPPAMFEEGGEGSSVRPINRYDNRGSDSSAGHQLRPYPDGTKVKYKITGDD